MPDVSDADRKAAFDTGLRLSKREWIEVYHAFARHAAQAKAERTAEIVARLRSNVLPKAQSDALLAAATAIEEKYRAD